MLGVDPRLLSASTRPWIATAVASGLVSVGLSVAFLTLVGVALDRTLAGAGPVGLWPAFAAVIAGKLAASGLERFAAQRASASTQLDVRDRIYAHALELGPGVIGKERTGELVNLSVEGMAYLEQLLGVYWVRFIIGLATPPLLVIYVATIDLPTAFALLLAVPLTPAFLGMTQRRFRSVTERYFATANRLAADFLDSLQGLVTLKLFNQGRARGERLRAATENLRRDTMRLLAVNQLVLFVVDWGFALGTTAVAAGMAVLRLQGGALTLGEGVTLVLISVELARPLNLIGAFFFAGAIGRQVARKVTAFLDQGSAFAPIPGREGEEPAVREAPAEEGLGIELDGVTLTYEGSDKPALDGVSLRVEPGETVALVGPSGAGKTSVVNLLLRFVAPQAGEARLGGTPIDALASEDLRRRIALVPQDPFLFYGTLADNLRVARADADRQALEAAARGARLLDVIEGFADGWDTRVGERGLTLSGGQAQRLAVARALLEDAPVVVLDEPTSQLDSATEAALRDALEVLTANKTVLIVAHRLSTVERADRIVVLDAGRVVESGSHAELLELGGHYARLVSAQRPAPRPETAGEGT